jgi:Kef-type K+ transport system membrane component KefB
MIVEAFQDYIPIIASGVVRAAIVFISTLGVVYMLGRGLELVNSNRGRNLIAILVSFGLSYWSIHIYEMGSLVNEWEIYWCTLVYASGSYLLFVLLGWRLYDRFDNFLDDKFYPDEKRKRK